MEEPSVIPLGNDGERIAVHAVAGEDVFWDCLLYTSDAADERSSVDLGGRRIIKKKTRAWNDVV